MDYHGLPWITIACTDGFRRPLSSPPPPSPPPPPFVHAGMVLSAFGEEEEVEPGEEPSPVEEPPELPHKSDLREDKPWPQEHSLCIFGPRNGIRR